MYLNSTFKAYVAETAAKVAASISTQFTQAHDVSSLKNDAIAEDIAIASVCVAEQVAYKLQHWWECRGDKQTVMFDPDDSPMTRTTAAIHDVAERLDEIQKEIARLCME